MGMNCMVEMMDKKTVASDGPRDKTNESERKKRNQGLWERVQKTNASNSGKKKGGVHIWVLI